MRQLVPVEMTDLMAELTETELLEKGVMALSWGMTPYQYFIGFSEDFPAWLTTEKHQTSFNGNYRIYSSTRELAFVRGELLTDYQKVYQAGDGFNTIKIPDFYCSHDGFYHLNYRLYMVTEDSLANQISPICFLVFDNNLAEIAEVSPALNYDIFNQVFTA